MSTHEITGGGGLKLAVHEFGYAQGKPIVLIHGFSQSHMAWHHQYNSDLANEFRLICMDIRGHGMSDNPDGAENYTKDELWADDVAAVIDQFGLKKPVLAGWSYGGFIMNDYVAKYGQDKIGGINYVASAVVLGNEKAEKLIGEAFAQVAPDLISEDLATRVAGTRRFLRDCYHIQPSQEEFETALAYNMVVTAAVRTGLVSRVIDRDEILSSISVPTLVTQGNEDLLVLKAHGEHIAGLVPNAKASFYEGVGHSPFSEAADRFNREIAELARSCAG